jgi:outer membrane translocation and assembly module TamA
VIGKIRLNQKFLQKYIDIPNGSLYSKQKLEKVDKKMLELPYVTTVQSSDITMLGSGSVLNLYLQSKKSSQVNFLVGVLPASGQESKLQLTGDVNLDLKNLLGSGEGFLLKWQQLQPKSPRLNLGYDQPYIFNSPIGLSVLFEMFKKDSNFLQLNAQGGIILDLKNNQTGKLFAQWQKTTLLTGAVDTNLVKIEKKLPLNIDVSSVNAGINYEVNATNYRFNPKKGNEINIVSLIGIKTIEKNNDIISIKDPSFNYSSLYDSLKTKSYQLRIRLNAAHYFPTGKSGTLKTAISSGFYSSPSIFRNELFQIGGYRLLRGFDEESIYAPRYAVFTAEYRYIINLNSYLYGFTDVGLTKNQYQQLNLNNQFIGAGLGILFERKAGLINISVALGKRDDIEFNLRQAAKIHFGYINYF